MKELLMAAALFGLVIFAASRMLPLFAALQAIRRGKYSEPVRSADGLEMPALVAVCLALLCLALAGLIYYLSAP